MLDNLDTCLYLYLTAAMMIVQNEIRHNKPISFNSLQTALVSRHRRDAGLVTVASIPDQHFSRPASVKCEAVTSVHSESHARYQPVPQKPT